MYRAPGILLPLPLGTQIVQQNKLRQGILGERREFQQKALVREIDIMKRLHHPYICRYKDVFIEEDNVCAYHVLGLRPVAGC